MKCVGGGGGGGGTTGGTNGVVQWGTNGSQAAVRGAAFNLIVLHSLKPSRTQWLSTLNKNTSTNKINN